MLPEAIKKYEENVDDLRKELEKIPKLFPDSSMLGGK